MQDHPPTSAGAGALSASVPQLARLLRSADKAVMLVHIHELLTDKGYKFKTVKLDERDIANGHWVRYPIADWHEQHFTWLGKNTVNTLLNSLRDDDGLLLTTSQRLLEDQPKYDRTLWYTLNYDALGKLLGIEPENLKTKRNKRLAPDDPNRTPAFSWSTPLTNATAEQDAPQSAPTPLTASDLAQDVTAAHVGREEAQETGGASTPTHTPRVELEVITEPQPTVKRLVFAHEKEGFLYWKELGGGRGMVRCSVQDYLPATQFGPNKRRYSEPKTPSSLPIVTGTLKSRKFELRGGALDSPARQPLEELYAEHYGFARGNTGKWERR